MECPGCKKEVLWALVKYLETKVCLCFWIKQGDSLFFPETHVVNNSSLGTIRRSRFPLVRSFSRISVTLSPSTSCNYTNIPNRVTTDVHPCGCWSSLMDTRLRKLPENVGALLGFHNKLESYIFLTDVWNLRGAWLSGSVSWFYTIPLTAAHMANLGSFEKGVKNFSKCFTPIYQKVS